MGRGNFEGQKGRPIVKYRSTAVSCAKMAEPIEMPFRLCAQVARSFIRYCGQGSSLLSTPARRPLIGPMHLPRREEGNWLMCANVCMMCREGGLSRREQLVGYLQTRPLKVWTTVWLDLAGTSSATVHYA